MGQISWHNHFIKFNGKSLNYKHWATCGLIRVDDALEDFKLCPNKIKRKLRITSDFIFEFEILRKAIPKRWMEFLVDTDVTQHHLGLLPASVHQVKMWENLDYKAVYNKMLMHNKSHLLSKQYWCAKLRLIEVCWEDILSNLFNSKLIPRIFLDFNWKVFYGVIPVKHSLKHMRKSDGVCKLCNQGVENNEHLFVICPKRGKFWENVAECIEISFSNQIRVSFETIVIGLTSDYTDYYAINMIVFICKWKLWKRRNEYAFENNLTSWEILWKVCKDHIISHVGSVLKSKMIKSSGMKSDVVKLHRLYLSLTNWNK